MSTFLVCDFFSCDFFPFRDDFNKFPKHMFREKIIYSETCVREPTLRLTLNSG